MKWGDVLRVKSEFPINLWPNAVQAYHHWIRTAVRDNVPYDRFARELLTASGSNFRVPPVNFYRAVQSRDPQAIAVDRGADLHGHANAKPGRQDRLADMAAFFSQIGYKATSGVEGRDRLLRSGQGAAGPGAGAPRAVVFPDGTDRRGSARPGSARGVRRLAASRRRTPGSRRRVVNRVWFWLLGRGIIHEPDDIRPDNPPANPELLAYLGTRAGRVPLRPEAPLPADPEFDDLPAVVRCRAAPARRPRHNFAHAILRPLEAEVLIDAINQITGMTEQYQSAIPEPYTFMPPEVRSIAIGDGSITSSFLGDIRPVATRHGPRLGTQHPADRRAAAATC